MRFWRSGFLRCCAIQKVIFVFFFFAILRAFWVVAGHFDALFSRELWQMPYKMDQPPRIVTHTVAGKGGHAGKAHAVLDNPEKLPVGVILCLSLAQVGRFRVQAAAKQPVAAAIVGMTDRAVVREMEPR